jgi:hypothetical protein
LLTKKATIDEIISDIPFNNNKKKYTAIIKDPPINQPGLPAANDRYSPYILVSIKNKTVVIQHPIGTNEYMNFKS